MAEIDEATRKAVAKAIWNLRAVEHEIDFDEDSHKAEWFAAADAVISAYLASQPKPCAVVRWEGWSAYIGSVKVGDITKAADHDPLFGDWVWRIFDHEPWDGACFTEPEAMAAVSSAACKALGLGEMAKPMWRHKKRGTTYTEIGRGFAQVSEHPIEEMTAVVIYQGSDGNLWVRNAVEFDDGRFEAAAPSPPSREGKE